MMKNLWLGLLIICSVLTLPLAADEEHASLRIGEANQLSSGQATAVAAGEGFLVVWSDHPSVLVQEIGATGQLAGLPKAVDDVASPSNVSIGAGLAGSGFVVAWTDPSGFYSTFRPPVEIFARRLDGASSPVGPTFELAPPDSESTTIRGVEGRDDGRFTVVWSRFSSLFNQGSFSSSTISPSDQALGTASGSFALDTALTDDGFVVVTRDTYAFETFIRPLDEDGFGSQFVQPSDPANSIARAPGEGFAILWKVFGDQLFLRRLDGNFTPLSPAVVVDASVPSQAFEGIVETPGGGFLMSWNRGTVLEPSIWMRWLRPDGVLEPAFEATSIGGWKAELSVDPRGRFLATWVEDGEIWTQPGAIRRSIDIDTFETAQPILQVGTPFDVGGGVSSTIEGIDMVGGERDIRLVLDGGVSGTAQIDVSGGALRHQQTGDATATSFISWDQRDGDAQALDTDGLMSLDLTSGGSRDAFRLEVDSASAGTMIEIAVDDGQGGSSSFMLDLSSGATAESFVLPFAAFIGTANFAEAGSLLLKIDGSSTPGLDVTLQSLETVSSAIARLEVVDLNGGAAQPGDILEYRFEVENPMDSHGASADGLVFIDSVPAGTQLICTGADAPVLSVGTLTGCEETEAGSIEVDFGNVVDGGLETVFFRVEMLDSADAVICNEGELSGTDLADVLTDDPSTVVSPDPTCLETLPPAALSVSSSSVVTVDADGSGDASAGDTMLLTVTIGHAGAAGAAEGLGEGDEGAGKAGGVRDAVSLVLTSSARNTALVVGSVSTSQGTISSGNTGGDSEVGVELGTLTEAQEATVSFELELQSLDHWRSDFRLVTEVEGDGSSGRNLFVIEADTSGGIKTFLRDTLLDDMNGDGFASPGDTLRYEVELENIGGRDANNVTYTSNSLVFKNESLVVGSVSTSLGTIIDGNGAGDDEVGVDLGLLEGLGAGVATITFDAVIDDPLDPGVDQAENHGQTLSPLGSRTDDPDTEEENDATITPIVLAPLATASLEAELIFDALGDGVVQTGDRLQFTLSLANTGTGTLHETLITSTADPLTRLLCGGANGPSSSLAAEIECAGNAGGAISFDLSKVTEGGAATLIWVVEAIDPAFATPVCGQADVEALGVDLLSDDPSTGAAGDPTCVLGAPSNMLIFFDDFESGDTGGWSASAP